MIVMLIKMLGFFDDFRGMFCVFGDLDYFRVWVIWNG